MAGDFCTAAATRPEANAAWAKALAFGPGVAELTLRSGASAFDDAGWTARCRAAGVTRVAVCGGGLEHGVAATVRAALAAGHQTWLLVDACCCERRDAGARAALDLRAAGAFLATHDRFLVLNASARKPTALALIEPLAAWAGREPAAAAAWAELLRRL